MHTQMPFEPIDLAAAERRIIESRARIERQRRLIQELEFRGHDTTSAQIVLDSWLISLSLHVKDRHRVRAMLNGR